MDRNAIMDALLQQMSCPAFLSISRSLQFWKDVDKQPALFVRNTGEMWPKRLTGTATKVTLEVEAWIYCRATNGLTASQVLDNLIGAAVASLEPISPAFQAQTLGGLVQHAWIEGKIEKDPGDLTQQAVGLIPISILVP